MTDPTAPSSLPTWADQMRALERVGDDLVEAWRPDGATPAEVQDMYKLALSMLAEGYLCRVYTDARRPVFMPLWNYAMNQGGPDPDYVYSTVEIDPRLTMGRDASIHGMSLPNAQPQEMASIHAAIIAGLENGTLRPVVGQEFPLEQAPAAHEAVMESGAHGKIVLIP